MNPLLISEFDTIIKSIDNFATAMRNKSILITGATGLIGSYLIEFLLYANQVLNLDTQIYATSSSMDKLNARFGQHPNLHFIAADLSKPYDFGRIFDYVIHAASPACPAAYAANPAGVMRVNLVGAMSILDTAVDKNSRLLLVSSGEIYGTNTDAEPFSETDAGTIYPATTRACYPESKRAAETMFVAHAAQFGTHVNIARPCYIYGPTITADNNRADAQFLRNALDGVDIVLNSAGNQRRTWCYVADTVAGLLHILIHGENCAAYNIANPNSIASIREFAEQIAKNANVGVQCTQNTITNAHSVLNAAKLMATGWTPVFDLKTGINHTFEIKKSRPDK